MHSSTSLDETYPQQKTSISQFLEDNSAFDCMPKNSYIAAIDKELSIYDAIQLLVEQNHEQLLMWDNQTIQWNWVFSLADAIRFVLFAVRQLLEHKGVNLQHNSFRKLSEDRIEMWTGMKIEDIDTNQQINNKNNYEQESHFKIMNYKIAQEEVGELIEQMQKVSLFEFMNEVYELKSFELKTVPMDSKLSFIILKMLSQKIHRIIVEEKGSRMFTSILNYKDILLFLLRSVNEQFTNTSEYNIPIGGIIQGRKPKQNTISINEDIWNLFDIMINTNKAVWMNVLDQNQEYVTTLFREDFLLIIDGWHIQLLSATIRQFIEYRDSNKTNQSIPDFQMFTVKETIKQIVEKIVMCRRNTLVCVDQKNRVQYTLGLSELFSLYIQ